MPARRDDGDARQAEQNPGGERASSNDRPAPWRRTVDPDRVRHPASGRRQRIRAENDRVFVATLVGHCVFHRDVSVAQAGRAGNATNG